MSQLFNSSRGFVFMQMLFVFFAVVWILTVFIRRFFGGGRPYIDVLTPAQGPIGPVGPMGPVIGAPAYGLPPATSMVLGSSANLAAQAQIASPVYGFPGAGYVPNLFDLILEDYIPYFAIGVLNVVAYRCWAFCLVNLFLVLVPILILNIARIMRCPIPWLRAVGLFWWAGWVMGWFINFWVIAK